jgi:hypothetical protein
VATDCTWRPAASGCSYSAAGGCVVSGERGYPWRCRPPPAPSPDPLHRPLPCPSPAPLRRQGRGSPYRTPPSSCRGTAAIGEPRDSIFVQDYKHLGQRTPTPHFYFCITPNQWVDSFAGSILLFFVFLLPYLYAMYQPKVW